MEDIAVWVTLVISGATLWFVATDRVRQNRRLSRVNLSTHVVRSVDVPGEGRCEVLDISNTGESTALVTVYSFAEVTRLIQVKDMPNPAEFTPRFTLAPGQGFSVVLPPEVPPNAWVHFMYSDTSDRRLTYASWTPAFSEYGPEFKNTRWDRIKRRITPPRSREFFPVGPGGAPATVLRRGPRLGEGLLKAMELLPQDASVQLRSRWSSDFPQPE